MVASFNSCGSLAGGISSASVEWTSRSRRPGSRLSAITGGLGNAFLVVGSGLKESGILVNNR